MDTKDVEGGSSSIIFVLIGAVIAFILLSRTERSEPDVSNESQLIHPSLTEIHQLKHIPTIGQSNYLCSYFDALKSLSSGPSIVRKGYEKVWHHFCGYI